MQANGIFILLTRLTSYSERNTVYCKVIGSTTVVSTVRILYVVECEVVSRNTAIDSSVIMPPCDTVGSTVVLVRISANIADKRDVVIN